jgi:hypothetical protein
VALPNLPTDNLYKFMAIAGLTLVVYSLIAPFALLNRNLEKIESVASEAAAIGADVKLLNESLKVDPVTPGDREEAGKRLEQSADVARRNAVLGVKREMVHRLNQQNLVVEIAGIVALLVGSALAVAGFYLWYDRVQKYLDAAAREGRVQ